VSNDDPFSPGKIVISFNQLSSAAGVLNSVSDELAKAVSEIDEVLQTLGLGVSKWVGLASGDSEHDRFWRREIGYAKIGSKWGVALRTIEGFDYSPEDANVEEWLFNEAPRWLRIEGIAKISDLLDGLTQEANKVAEDIKAKVGHARDVSTALKEAAAQARARALAARRK
jgi:hypothetical protein